MDAVMQFAIHKLGFLPENILVYGWSIGIKYAYNLYGCKTPMIFQEGSHLVGWR